MFQYKQKLKNMNDLERNQLAKQYMPLVKKMSIKMYHSTGFDYEEVEGFAWQGLVDAMNKYDSNRSTMSFTSFAAYYIRHAILNGTNQNGKTIKVSYYKRKKMEENGEDLPVAVSISKNFENEDYLEQLGTEDEYLFDDPWGILKRRLEENFKPEWTDMFFSVYGLYGKEVEKSKDVANRQGVSGCLITKRMKKMIQFIKEDKELSSILRDLL